MIVRDHHFDLLVVVQHLEVMELHRYRLVVGGYLLHDRVPGKSVSFLLEVTDEMLDRAYSVKESSCFS